MKTNLWTSVSSATLVAELNAYGIAVVLADPTFVGRSPVSDFQQFIDYYDVDQTTPVLLSPVIPRLFSLTRSLSHIEAYFVERTGWIFSPGEDVAAEQMVEALVERIRSGQPVILIAQTARALPIRHIDIWADGLTEFEKTMLAFLIEWQSRVSSKPVVVALALANGQRQVPTWRLALTWMDASRYFAATSRKVRNLMPSEAEVSAAE